MIKTALVLIFIVLFIPVVAFGAEGQPFKALQEQIDQLKIQLQNIQLIPGPQGPAGPTGATGATGPTGPAGVANGITRAVHGAVSGDGEIIQGSGFHLGTGSMDRACWLDIYCWVTIYFDTPFSTTPTCTVSDLYGGGDEIHLGIGNVTETTFTVDTRHGEYDVIIVPPPVYAQHLPFTFICVE